MNKIILLVGKSGSGKTTLANTLKDKYGLKVLNSYTTRKPRYENEQGHIFLSEKEFNDIKIKDIVAFTHFDNNKYCATIQQVEESDVYVIDVEGVRSFKKYYKGNKTPLVIYLKTSLETRKKRMKERGDSELAISERLRNDAFKFINAEEIADLVLENDEHTDLKTLASKVWLNFIRQ